MIKHHNYFKVHLPKKEYKGEHESELTEIIMEEFYLLSEGKMTESYTAVNSKEDKFEISLYPSIPYAANKLNYTETEKFQFINSYLDNAFVDFLVRFNPLHKSTGFIEYHLYYYEGDKNDFIKHIRYEILSIIKKRKESDKNTESDYKNLEIIISDWVSSKMKNENDYSTNIGNAQNVIVNNGNRIRSQGNFITKSPKDKLAIYAFWITVIGLVISVIIGWKEIKAFFI